VTAREEGRLLLPDGAAEDGGPPVGQYLGQQLVVGVEEGERPVVPQDGGVPSFEQSGDPSIQKPGWRAFGTANGREEAGEEAEERAVSALVGGQAPLGRVG
jgi:hypothetical protein